MKLLHVEFGFILSLTACFFAGTATKSRPWQAVTGSSNRAVLSKYIKDQETYAKVHDDVKEATKKALGTCREVFEKERWNCVVNDSKLLVRNGKQIAAFAGNILPANKEGAYLQALGSASVMYTLTSNCRSGRYEDCACVPIDKPKAPGQTWRWSGCNENLNFGEDVTKHFFDTLERKADRRTALNLHNNEVGRKVVRIAAKKECKCLGPTASCITKACWRKLLDFTEVGKLLKKKYDKAVRVKYANNTIKPFRNTGAPLAKGRHGHLAYLDSSPNYCRPDSRTGFPGMQERKCIHSKVGAQKCDRMCTSCGLRFNHKVAMEREKCQCKFEWCCHIKCEFCEKSFNVTICS